MNGRLIGYARVSTGVQDVGVQVEALRAAGCEVIAEEYASGADADRPVLARLLAEMGSGDTLVVVRLDRLARSVRHLLEVVASLQEKGTHFRSLGDPVDTTTPQGRFALQVLGAVAELERSLIAERTRAALASARRRGRVGGNPGLRRREGEALRRLREARRRAWLERVLAEAEAWLPVVRQMRPHHAWEEVVRVLNRDGGKRRWTADALRRRVRLLVAEGLAEAEVLGRAPRSPGEMRLLRLVAGLRRMAPEATLAELAGQLEAMGERTPRGSHRWRASSLYHLLRKAGELGLLERA